MARTCREPGCTTETATSYGAFCKAHSTRLRRHGSTTQEPVTKAALAPYLKIVAARREKNTGSVLWETLEARWRALLTHGERITAAFHAGRPGTSHEVTAAHEMAKLGNEWMAKEVIDTALAMFIMHRLEPRRFRTDRAFTAQLVRRVRGVGDMNVGEAWDHRVGKPRRVYRDTTPRVSEIMGSWITEAFGAPGLRLAEMEERDLDARQEEVRALYQAMGELR